jgi:hypothetical protein
MISSSRALALNRGRPTLPNHTHDTRGQIILKRGSFADYTLYLI